MTRSVAFLLMTMGVATNANVFLDLGGVLNDVYGDIATGGRGASHRFVGPHEQWPF